MCPEQRLLRRKCCLGCRGGREPVGALVERIPGVAGDLHQLHRAAIQLGGDRLDGWLVLDGRRALVRQPPRRQPGSHVVTQSIAYWLSVRMTIAWLGWARSASRMARSSISWLVVTGWPPLASVNPVVQAQPPGPGLPKQAPSVATCTGPFIFSCR